jgi:hypothetical protein
MAQLEDVADVSVTLASVWALLVQPGWLVVGAQEPFDALVVDGLPVIQALRITGQENLDAVAGPLGDLGRVGARAQPGGQRRVAQVVGAFRERGAGEGGWQGEGTGLVPDPGRVLSSL